ncbi:hypothetical protein M378DRAFT_787408 [Amanita muscaria Koide BX008]|uniref:Zn(2)-C6 fungal-type domain-containing protein n=1 Tax=Amanita muscaria (strain Koide BX008) TaxID=946122 RepID=A0A0C2XJ24_AMAMK|nr:hypothetical protein M378DRAFT_787408 [Amanita muscaria Koide BX008]
MLPLLDNLNPDVSQAPSQPNVFVKAKRKRLAKVRLSPSHPFSFLFTSGPQACDACHKSKRRCDGTAPCSNCFYATKACTYTDSSGRPVPAPRPYNPERNDPQPSQSYATFYPEPSRYNRHPSGYSPNPSTSNQPTVTGTSEDDSVSYRKRIKNERGNPISADDALMDGPISGPSMDRPVQVKLDPSLTRELTNLFFTHCHPARIIIHKPSFSTALSHNLVPRYLIHAICALAAPLSKQPRIRTKPARFAGKPFAQEAMVSMFDGAGRLVCEPNLPTAQALCLLQIHDMMTKDKNMFWNTRYHDLALQIVKGLGVYSPEHPLLTPMPTPEYIQQLLEREAVRRIFWLIHMLDVMISIYFKRPLAISEPELRVRLPADETSFELAPHSTLPEYLHLPPIKTQDASEFGHLIRVLLIYARVEHALDRLTDLKGIDLSVGNPTTLVHEAEQSIRQWSNVLPSHLHFSDDNLSVQQSMFETSSNDGAWCYCCMHIYHASTFIALNNAQQLLQGAPSLKVGPQWATNMLDKILNMLGERGRRSLLMSAALWTYAGLCGRNDSHLQVMADDYEEYWGTRMLDLVQNWKSRMSASKQKLHQHITPPQKYCQNNTLKRRRSEDGDLTPPGSQSPIRQSTPSRSSTSSIHDICNTNSPQPSLKQFCEASSSTLHSRPSNQSMGVTAQRMQLSDNVSSWIDISHTSPKLGKQQSPILSTPNPLREDRRHPLLGDPHLHQQFVGKDNVGTPIPTGLLFSNSDSNVKGNNERQGYVVGWNQQHRERTINED